MRIALSEIWNFSELIEAGEKGWAFNLVAGPVVVEGFHPEDLVELKNDADYDTELLPELFTFREILWQPDIFTDAQKSFPGLRILQAYCEEEVIKYQEDQSKLSILYASLIGGLGDCCKEAVETLEKEPESIKKVLGAFRTSAFPIVKFFIFHPQNRVDYYRDAVNRLNYAVKIILTQFNARYTSLEDPYWEVTYDKKKGKAQPQKSQEENL